MNLPCILPSPEKKGLNTSIITKGNKPQELIHRKGDLEGLIANVKLRNDQADQDLMMFLNKTKGNIESASTNHPGMLLKDECSLLNYDKSEFKIDLINHENNYNTCSLQNMSKCKEVHNLFQENLNHKKIRRSKISHLGSDLSRSHIPLHLISDKESRKSVDDELNIIKLTSDLEKNIINKEIVCMISSNLEKMVVSNNPLKHQDANYSNHHKAKHNQLTINTDQLHSSNAKLPQIYYSPQGKVINANKINPQTPQHSQLSYNISKNIGSNSSSRPVEDESISCLSKLQLSPLGNHKAECSRKKPNNLFCCF